MAYRVHINKQHGGCEREASASPLVWQLGVTDAMKHFGLRNDQVHAARRAYLLKHGAKAVAEAQDRQLVERLRRKVVNAERRYPGLSARLTTESLQTIGDDFNVSRQCVHALLGNLRKLATLTGKSMQHNVSTIVLEAVR